MFLSEGFIVERFTPNLTHTVISSIQFFVFIIWVMYSDPHWLLEETSLSSLPCVGFYRAADIWPASFTEASNDVREHAYKGSHKSFFVTLSQKETSHHFCHTLLINTKWLGPVYTQKKGIIHKHEHEGQVY